MIERKETVSRQEYVLRHTELSGVQREIIQFHPMAPVTSARALLPIFSRLSRNLYSGTSTYCTCHEAHAPLALVKPTFLTGIV